MSGHRDEPLFKDGKRLDGRELDEMRPMEAKIGVVKRANGSAFFKFGKTSAIAAVYGPRDLYPKFKQDPQKAVIRCKYSMLPFSTDERIRPGTSRRSTEISKILGEALSNSVFLEEYPKTGIDVFIDIIQADASTRCAALNAASLALADAGVPMRDMISCCSVGKVDGRIVLDVAQLEDNFGEVDMPVAITDNGKIVLLQIDGFLTKEEFGQALRLAEKGCAQIYEKQKEAIRKRYEGVE
ncbi:exosome complex exonuclease Rrp41 [archaeon]|nr:MAG: exosome complex exonuclease Rrp41 [archaeon]